MLACGNSGSKSDEGMKGIKSEEKKKKKNGTARRVTYLIVKATLVRPLRDLLKVVVQQLLEESLHSRISKV
jgi:hypothetical protein